MSAASGMPRLSWEQARESAYAAAGVLPTTRVELSAAVGRVLAEPVVALCEVPHYASSAMDGWAVRGPGPWVLRAADRDAPALEAGEARAIVTGGLIPEGADAVLRSEVGDVVSGGSDATGRRLLRSSVTPWIGQHIRPRGEEFGRGEVGIDAGARLNPAHIAVAAACGVDEVAVRARARVSLVFTGDEVVTHGIPAPGTVRDSFGPQLPAFVELLGAEVAGQTRIGDDHGALVRALSTEASAHDVIITTGGTGDSSADHLRGALDRLGAHVLIDGVAMRPGGPSIMARLDDGRLLIGLPGNPLAAMMGLLTLAAPVLAALADTGLPELSRVRLGAPVAAGRGETRLIPFRLVGSQAEPSTYTGSAMLRGLADASGVLVCTNSGSAVGDEVEFVPLPWVR
ncbi:molybdopterin molybdotransferase MoeA [Agreia pratensis]|uniref:molybdopterin molybdotransferase MoeA n=1 Tax=Agreia pratensis TaxID=150121 RepID=UPI00188B3446|nr:molybdopterin molybdotransferase MoeA [Agreia pratensis]MBF4635078.1 molybdopterin molybdotransferase MoeA [Agreia pratensis]